MKTWEPWETAWPAGLALAVVFAALAAGGHRVLRVGPRDRAAAFIVFASALVIRLFWIPSWADHIFDGHEAEYFDLFRGERTPNRGGTVLYPAMQWLWWGLGRILPHHPRVPVVLMAMVGSVGAAISMVAVKRLTNNLAGIFAGLFVALHPVHAVWSSSAYNVVLPHTLGVAVMLCAAHVAGQRRAPLSVAWLASGLSVLCVSTRMDAAVVLLTAVLVAVSSRPVGMKWGPFARDRMRLLAPAGFALVIGAAAVWPLVYPGEVPGAGERALSFEVNAPFLGLYVPQFSPVYVGTVSIAALVGVSRYPRLVGIMVLSVVLNHLALSTFDDLGDRHLLTALFPTAVLVGAAASTLETRRWVGVALVSPLVVVVVTGLLEARERYYASEERFAAELMTAPWRELPRLSVAEARVRDGAMCGWIAEDPRVATPPYRSHFNLLKPEEASMLRGESGCLRWCVDVQDWRWSSRGVRDRALRVQRMYELMPVAVVEQSDSGYACLVVEVGNRRCCGEDLDEGDAGAMVRAARSEGSLENHEQRVPAYPQLP